MSAYDDFLRSKITVAVDSGFEVDDSEINPILKPHQRLIVPYRAIMQNRKALGIELSNRYFLDAVTYCEMAAREMATPDLFDILEESREIAGN